MWLVMCSSDLLSGELLQCGLSDQWQLSWRRGDEFGDSPRRDDRPVLHVRAGRPVDHGEGRDVHRGEVGEGTATKRQAVPESCEAVRVVVCLLKL